MQLKIGQQMITMNMFNILCSTQLQYVNSIIHVKLIHDKMGFKHLES